MEEFEAIYLPLSEDGVNVSHVLLAFFCGGEKMLGSPDCKSERRQTDGGAKSDSRLNSFLEKLRAVR